MIQFRSVSLLQCMNIQYAFDCGWLFDCSQVMRVNKFESAIVMGTMASVELPSHSQDTRVLQTMLLLRKTHSELYPETSLHVVGENCFDSTAVLPSPATQRRRRVEKY